jgi:hypothetical protein
MNKENTKKLAEKYPTVFQELGGHPTETCMAWGIAVGDGWYNIIDELCQTLEKHGVVAAQVKEKFGGLRFYTNSIRNGKTEAEYNEVQTAIRLAEEKAYRTCEYCGKPGERRGGSWIKVLCDECNKEE